MKSRSLPFMAILILAMLLLPAPASRAQMPTGKDHLKFQPIERVSGSAGDTVLVSLKFKIDRHWHTYGLIRAVGPDGLGPDPTEISVGPKSVARLAAKPRVIKGGRTHFDSTWGTKIEELSGAVEIMARVVLDRRLKKGTQKGTVTVGVQMCDTTGCMPFEEIQLPIEYLIVAEFIGDIGDTTVDALVSTPKVISAGPSLQSGESEVSTEKQKGLWSFFFYAMGIGFLALLTPCVFPMIPITVSFFTKRHEKRRGKGIQESMLFGLGIISTFTAVGIIASLIFGGTAVQDLAANAWLNLGIGILFMILAFNLFGAFEIQVPISLMNALNKKSQGDGSISILLMGLTFSLTSFTCTVPFVGTLLLSASGGDILYPAIGTLGFATAFAIPFVALSMFPSLLVRLPRAGGWMNNLKVVMGFLEIAAAIKFFSTAEFVFGLGLLPREVFLSIWAGVCLIITLYLVGTFEMKLDSKLEKVGALRALFAVCFATLTIWFIAGALGKPLAADLEALLPPENYHQIIDQFNGASAAVGPTSMNMSHGAAQESMKWYTNLDEAKKVAAKEGKPIFIDFTGFACVNCRLMEKLVFPKPEVQEMFKKFVLVQLYTDKKTEPYITNQNILKSFGTVANPLYVLLKSDGTYVAQSGFQNQYRSNSSLFIDFLKKAL
ncbi:MAG: thioredoxin family protein [Candidatus Kapabacteria bacterium]|nr:thioredoxin family protein [Candidatus Kapabacteria bacterium]